VIQRPAHQRHREAGVAARGAEAHLLALEDDDIQRRLGLRQEVRGPQPREPAADDADVASGDTDAATVERALKDYLVERLLDRVQASSGLSEEEANRIAYEELHAMRRERDNA